MLASPSLSDAAALPDNLKGRVDLAVMTANVAQAIAMNKTGVAPSPPYDAACDRAGTWF